MSPSPSFPTLRTLPDSFSLLPAANSRRKSVHLGRNSSSAATSEKNGRTAAGLGPADVPSVRGVCTLNLEDEDVKSVLVDLLAFLSDCHWEGVLHWIRGFLDSWPARPASSELAAEAELVEGCVWSDSRLDAILKALTPLLRLSNPNLPLACRTLRNIVRRYAARHRGVLDSLYSRNANVPFLSQAEALFLSVATLSEDTGRRRSTWLLQASLLILCSEGVSKMVTGEDTRPPSLNKKAHFLADLRRAIRNNSGTGGETHTALACYADFCQYASLTDAHSAGILRAFAKDKFAELFVRPVRDQQPPARASGPCRHSLDVGRC